MNTKDTGGPAFARGSGSCSNAQQGMTLRDYFAAKVMNALIIGTSGKPTSLGTEYVDNNIRYALAAYAVADAMLEARK